MPPKKKVKKKTKPQMSATGESADNVVQRFLKTYEVMCGSFSSSPSPSVKSAMKEAMEAERFLTKIVLEPLASANTADPKVHLEPLLAAMRTERYNYIKDIHVWDLPMTSQEATALALMLEKGIYDIRLIDLLDNLIDSYAMLRLAKTIPTVRTLVSLSLDYNEFGDEGCGYLCTGLSGNDHLLELSLNYCGLTAASAPHLSKVIATTALRDVFLDGNDFGCQGAEQLILACVERAEQEMAAKNQEVMAKAKAAAQAEEEAKARRYNIAVSSASRAGSAATKENHAPDSAKHKKKKKKGKKKAPPGPPPVGPWIRKLHLADNGIDSLDQNFGDFLPLQCMRVFKRLIANSEFLQEIDLEDNLIGDVAALELLDALVERKDVNGLSGIKLRTTHRIKAETLKELCKLGSGKIQKKKKKRGKKKK